MDAGWYPDPQSPNEQRYFDGRVWTGHRVSPPPATQTPDAGWYPDPENRLARRRYWDGSAWTDHYATPVVAGKSQRELAVWAVAGALVIVGALIFAVVTDSADDRGAAAATAAVVFFLGGGILLALRSDARRKDRQRRQDQGVSLVIDAEIEHRAYLQNDDERGVYGKFPPPPGD